MAHGVNCCACVYRLPVYGDVCRRLRTYAYRVSEVWYAGFGRSSASAIAYMQIIHWVGLLVPSIPLGILLGYFRRESAVLIGCLVGAFLCIETLLFFFVPDDLVAISASFGLSLVLDSVKFLVTLPLVCLLALRLIKRTDC